MKRASFKLHPDRGGWLRTTLCPINEKQDTSFGAIDVCMFTGLVLGVMAIARLLLAH